MTNSDDIRKYYSIFINTAATIARNFDAKIIKNVGDSLIYYFPNTGDSSNERAFSNALLCCVTMNAANSVISDKLEEESLPAMQYRISADYGKVEIAKTKTSQDYDFFGSTINLCAKINKISAPDKILIGGDLFRVLRSLSTIRNDYNIRPAGEYSVGIKHSYPLYTVTSKYDKPVIGSFKQIPDLKPLERDPLSSVRDDLQERTRSPARVMLVDDDRDILFTFQTMLTSQGILVDSYQDPHEALKHFSQADHNYYNLIILDIRMPGLNGLELYSRLKAIDRDIKILFVSALDASEELISVLPGIAADSILRKPLEKDYFVSAVKRKLSN
jgi:two-component system, OmpR family, response regulator ChvI